MALSVLSFSVSRLQDSLLGTAALQPSWADQPWPYKFSVSPVLRPVLTELIPVAAVFLEGG